MKHLLLTTIAAELVVESRSSRLLHRKQNQNRRQAKHHTSQFIKLPGKETSKP
ncbi:hypothetical protein OAK15_00530 [Verrucomicrobia bacterium]|nr:hypothetical protein [Verrucomicrobiota bacterium]